MLSPHSLYQALGNDARARQAAYQKLFCFKLDSGLLNEIKRRLTVYVFVRCKFLWSVALAIGRRTWRGAPGRPQKAHLEEGQRKFPF
ncbi:MAG: hypothetical protein DRR19_23760 [Candidatus Parabeggiatoa sp. nov. 1]|nr:MAG: hypothetical protein DRR19_23760 [Gammaproteobacteria bacterium]